MRSDCPLNFAVELFGDKWTLLIIRDLIFFDKRYYQEFLSSQEKISTNILADRLTALEKNGFVRKGRDERHKQKIIYRLTEKGINLVPMLIEIALWSDKYGENVPQYKKDFILKEVRKDKTIAVEKLMEDLHKKHVQAPA